MKVAIVHEWLVNIAGSEKVVAEWLKIWPDADLFAVVDFLSERERATLGGKHATTTFIQRLPQAKKRYQAYLPLMPIAIEQLDVGGYDLILSSSHAVAKGVLTGPDQIHISYVHSPMRYAWDFQHQYLREAKLTTGIKSMAARSILHYLRMWDQRTSAGVDFFVGNSGFICRRIMKAYNRKADVIYPPVDTDAFAFAPSKEDFYLTASRMVPYKKIPLIVEAFAGMPDKKLVVIGDGPEFEKARQVAGPNAQLMGYQPFDVLLSHMQRAKAFVFAAEEDFGITPVEAQACGTPVIAYGKGGALETVVADGTDAATGVFYEAQTVEAIQQAVRGFEADRRSYLADACRANAERFSAARFRAEFSAYVERRMAEGAR